MKQPAFRLRPAGPQDLPGLRDLWADRVRSGHLDCVPGPARLDWLLAGFDWESNSRVIEGDPRLRASVLVTTHGGRTRVEAAGRDEAADLAVTEWGLSRSRATGAEVALVWRAKGDGGRLRDLGLTRVRSWWRMDRPLEIPIPEAPLPEGYRLVDATAAISDEVWTDVYNRAFADHWRPVPEIPSRLARRRQLPGWRRNLELMALAREDDPVASVRAYVETASPDKRPQPIGMVSTVGTVPEHRRRGLARALTAEALRRLAECGARTASLYVDGQNVHRAFDVYRRLGFEVAFGYEVWEAVFA